VSIRIEGNVRRGSAVAFTVDGATVTGIAGESLATALLAAGIRRLRSSPKSGASRGIFCMMGSCQECLVRVGGNAVLACMEPVHAGMVVSLGVKP
jgi:predicted molibdopterin-dependent oxidoreductase YjgC